MKQITPEDFEKLTLCVGTVLEAHVNKGARKPAFVLKVDFGREGIKTSSAQLTENYTPEALLGRQVVGLLHLPEKRIAGVKSEFLILGALSTEKGVVLLRPDQSVEKGSVIG